ncbi:LolA family protein [Sneathiella chinensis]|nr:outer membrane lipoprotein carrier protein LolA [Sneathiella chinensis]
MFKFLLPAALVSLLGVILPVQAADLSLDDREQIARVEAYLNDIQSMKARFLQINAEGMIAQGDVYLRRPGRMRFEYEPPAQILVVADGTWLVMHDKELNETTRLPLRSTPLSVLLEETVSFKGAVQVISVERDAGTLRLNVINTKEPDEGGITLVFRESPLKLRQWLVTDVQGNTTSITLSDVERNLPLEAKLFTFFDSDYDKSNN